MTYQILFTQIYNQIMITQIYNQILFTLIYTYYDENFASDTSCILLYRLFAVYAKYYFVLSLNSITNQIFIDTGWVHDTCPGSTG